MDKPLVNRIKTSRKSLKNRDKKAIIADRKENNNNGIELFIMPWL